MTKQIGELVDALVRWLTREGKRQQDVAEMLSLSSRVYILFEHGHWLPPERERHFFAHTLHGLHPSLGEVFARACGTTPLALGIATVDASPSPRDAEAKLVYDAAVYAAAEATDVPPRVARGLVAAVIARLAEGGVSMGQAREVGRSPAS